MQKLITTVLMGLLTVPPAAWADSSRPKLVVGIVVDQLRTDYVEYLQDYFGRNGFRKLMSDGVYMRDVDFKTSNLDAPSATAMLFTGSYPARTGVPSATVYDQTTKSVKPVLSDPKTLGNFTNDSYSPDNLRLTTVSDEVAVDGLGLSAVYALGTDPQQAIIMAGHAGTSASWINPSTGNWATTTYYTSLPQPLSTRNYTASLASRLDTMQWRPSMPIERMPGLPAQKRIYPFSYTFPHSDREVFERFAASPLGNREVTDMAIECLRSMQLGTRGDATDMLNVAYTVAPYKYVKDGDFRAELTDSYLRLDSEIGRLIDAIDKYVGASEAVIWVSSTGYYDDAVLEDKKYRLPGGEFSMKRAKSLLNSYLSARHGNAGYIDLFRNGQIYLDRKTIDDKNLDINDVLADARSFLAKMSGISDVLTLNDILSPTTPDEESLRVAVDPKQSGDLFVSFNPGWVVVNDLEYPVTSTPVRETPVCVPAFIMGGGVAPQIITTPVDATALAPTVSSILRIRSPNGAVSKPLILSESSYRK